MAIGPGKYDEVCTKVRHEAQADGVILIIMNGKHGTGFSMQASPEKTAALPAMLEHLAAQIRADLAQMA
jgi:hypothetical protein